MSTQKEVDPDVYTIVDAVAWSPDGALLAVASGDYFGLKNQDNLWVRVLNVTTGQVIFTAPHESRAHLAWSPLGEELYIGSGNGVIQRFKIKLGALEAEIPRRDWHVWYCLENMDLSPDGNRIAAIFGRLRGPQELVIYDTKTLQPVINIDLDFTYPDENALTWVGYSPDSSLLATTAWDGLVRIWDASSLSLLKTLSISPGGRLYAGDWSTDGRLAVGGWDKRVTIWNVSTQQIVNSFDVGGGADSLSWHPDGRQIAVYVGSVWDTITSQDVKIFNPNGSTALDWSPAGILAYSISGDGLIEIAPDANPLGMLVSLVTVPTLPPASTEA